MSHITIEEVKKTAALAKLEFTDEEMVKFTGQFERIIGFVEVIGSLDTDNIKPMTHAVEKNNVLRDDAVKPSMTIEEIESISPEFKDGGIAVPRIIES